MKALTLRPAMALDVDAPAGAGRNAARQGLAAQSQKASAQSAAKKVPRNQELSAKQKALFDQATGGAGLHL